MKLSEHEFKKGKFITPFNAMDTSWVEASWFKNRLPEYLWLALIVDKYGRSDGLNLCRQIVHFLLVFGINNLGISEFLKLSHEDQTKIWKFISQRVGKETLSPLTTIITFSISPSFSVTFVDPNNTLDARIKKLEDVMRKASNHQSYFSTDIRFVVLLHQILIGRMKFGYEAKSTMESIGKYPYLSHSDERMKLIRPSIRATEISINIEFDSHKNYVNYFWKELSRMNDCSLYICQYSKDADDTDEYVEKIGRIIHYYSDLFTTSYPLDDKFLVLLGISTYSYKRVLELVEHNLYNEISGRSIVRVLIEDFIMMKYLLKHESEHDNIWLDYQYYGIGQYKLIAARAEETDRKLDSSHVSYHYLSFLINELKDELFVDMDTKYFDRVNIREKAKDVDEKELYGLYYDYDSAFEHGLWGAIRESSLLKCDAAGHQFHCVPDVENKQKMKSVWSDIKMIMTKTIIVLKDCFGLPEQFDFDGE